MEKTDILIIGATGFVGKRYTRELIPYLEETRRSAVATARNLEKLNALKQSLPECSLLKFELLDISQEQAVKEKVSKAKIVANFAGPFDRYGDHVVGACAENGVHYVDITGEIQFGRRMVEKYHELAKKNGAIIIPFAGFDSVPSDYGAYVASKALAQEYKTPSVFVDVVYRAKGGVNGGTIASAIDINSKIKSSDWVNRNYMVPDLTDKEELLKQEGPRFQKDMACWVGPFLMEQINNKVVYRTVDLLPNGKEIFASDYRYRESQYLGRRFSKANSVSASIVLKGVEKFLGLKFGRTLASKFATSPGEGPSESVIQKGFFQSDIYAKSKAGDVVHFQMKSDGDPGNKSTVKLIMACTQALLDGKVSEQRGLLTPATAFEEHLLPYLEKNKIFLKEIK